VLLLSKVLSPKEIHRLTLQPTSSRFGGSRLRGKCVLMKRGDFIAFSASYPGRLICCTRSSFSESPAFSLRSSAIISSCTNKLNLPKKNNSVQYFVSFTVIQTYISRSQRFSTTNTKAYHRTFT